MKPKRLILLSVTIVFLAAIHSSAADPNSPAPDNTTKPSPPVLPEAADPNSTIKVSAPCKVSAPWDESIADPNELLPEQKIALQNETKPTETTATAPPAKLWQRRYHPQVTTRIFNVLCYPYYQGGKPYPLSDALSEPLFPENDISLAPMDPNQTDPDSKTVTIRYHLESCCDLIHQWRNINESSETTLEVVRSIELTRRATGIYHINPKLAIEVKRTLGRIGRLNCQFDLAGRFALQNLLLHHHDKFMTARLEKHLQELQTLLELLCEQNDAVTLALGIGKINRQVQYAPIYYTNLGLPNVPSELYKEQ